jgi:hypothetical protein
MSKWEECRGLEKHLLLFASSNQWKVLKVLPRAGIDGSMYWTLMLETHLPVSELGLQCLLSSPPVPMDVLNSVEAEAAVRFCLAHPKASTHL